MTPLFIRNPHEMLLLQNLRHDCKNWWVLSLKITFFFFTKCWYVWLWVNLTRNHITKQHLNVCGWMIQKKKEKKRWVGTQKATCELPSIKVPCTWEFTMHLKYCVWACRALVYSFVMVWIIYIYIYILKYKECF